METWGKLSPWHYGLQFPGGRDGTGQVLFTRDARITVRTRGAMGVEDFSLKTLARAGLWSKASYRYSSTYRWQPSASSCLLRRLPAIASGTHYYFVRGSLTLAP